jgi:ABC-type branched-subunit amino acid transport system ATPase component
MAQQFVQLFVNGLITGSILALTGVGASLVLWHPAGRFEDRLAAVLDTFPALASRLSRRAATLSGGQRQMLGIARALISDPRLLVLGEPSAGLAPKVVDKVFATVKQINARGVSVLMVEQKARQCLAMADQGYVLDMGRNRIHGTGPNLLNDKEVIELYLGRRGRLGAAVLRLREEHHYIRAEVG